MNKQQFIQSIKTANPEWDAQQILEYANTPFLHPVSIPKRVLEALNHGSK